MLLGSSYMFILLLLFSSASSILFLAKKNISFYFNQTFTHHCSQSLEAYFNQNEFEQESCIAPKSDHYSQYRKKNQAPAALCLLIRKAQFPSNLTFFISNRTLSCS